VAVDAVPVRLRVVEDPALAVLRVPLELQQWRASLVELHITGVLVQNDDLDLRSLSHHSHLAFVSGDRARSE
jgi:hypothetical protein